MSVVLSFQGQQSGWSQSKQYASALFYLSHVHSTPINEAQWGRLNALQLQIAYGPFSESTQLPEFRLCSLQERKRREEEWKGVSKLSKPAAIRAFLDIMSNLFPNWHKSRPVVEEFDGEWLSRMSISSHPDSLALSDPPAVKSKSPFPVPRPRRKEHKVCSSISALERLEHYELQKLTASAPRLPKLNAVIDAGFTLSRLKGEWDESKSRDATLESKYYTLPRSNSGRAEHEGEEVSKAVLTGLYETLTSGKLVTKSDNEFVRNLMAGAPNSENAFLAIAKRLESARAMPHVSDSAVFPKMSASSLEALLRPRLEINSEVLSELDNVLRDELKNKAGVLAIVIDEYQRAINCVFTYISAMEKHALELRQRLENLEFEYDTHAVTFEAMCEMYSLENAEKEVFGVSKPSIAEFQVEITRGLTVLRGENAEKLRNCDRNLRSMAESLTTAKANLAQSITAQEKLIDTIHLLEASVFEGVESTFKGKKPPVNLRILPKNEAESPTKLQCSELEVLRTELLETKRENELLLAKLQGFRRRSSVLIEEADAED